jgi:hypothetical protein
MRRLRYLVTGTGRSGTVYLANLLTSASIPCGHEAIFTPGGLPEARARLEGRTPINVSDISLASCGDWLPSTAELAAESSYMAAPFLDDPLLAGTCIIHVVRHPLQVISSFVVGLGYFYEPYPTDFWQEFIYAYLPELRQDWHPLERAALYYVRWNRVIEERSHGKKRFFVRIEDGIPRLLRRLCLQPNQALLAARTINSRMDGKPRCSYDDLPAGVPRDELFKIADQYGYTLAPHHHPERRLWRNFRRMCRSVCSRVW